MSLKYKDLQPWIDMLVDALENKGASSSGIPNPNVFPYAEKYRALLLQVRNKELSEYNLEQTLQKYKSEIKRVSEQKYRTDALTKALHSYFIKEFNK